MGEHASRIGVWRQPSGVPGNFPSPALRSRATTPPPATLCCIIALLGGLFGGLLGIGGGSVIAPLLLLFGKLRPPQVAGTTLATVLVISVVGSGAYASLGHVNFDLVWPIAIGSVIGSVLGALTSRRLSTRLMIMTFLLILPYFAAKEFWPSLAAPVIATHLVFLGILGLGAEFLSGLLGISGASLVVPSLVAFFLIDHHAAQGIALGVAVSDSLAGEVTHARARNINYRVFLYMAAPALAAAMAGAFLSDSMSVTALRFLSGALMVTVWMLMLARLVRGWKRDRTPSDGRYGARPQEPDARDLSVSLRGDRASGS